MEFWIEFLRFFNKIDILVIFCGTILILCGIMSPISFKGHLVNLQGKRAYGAVIIGFILVLISFQEVRIWLFKSAQIAQIEDINSSLTEARNWARVASTNTSDAKTCSARAVTSASHADRGIQQTDVLLKMLKIN